jgi:PAB-dependent poly(A)-specific ribonuclease subunit 3
MQSDLHQAYQPEYDPTTLDSFYPPQPTFTRQPVSCFNKSPYSISLSSSQLNYHLYTRPIPSNLNNNFLSDNLREELQARSEITRTAPALGLGLPDEIQGYHTLVPLENTSGERRKILNWNSTVYRATNSKDGLPYVLRRIESALAIRSFPDEKLIH